MHLHLLLQFALLAAPPAPPASALVDTPPAAVDAGQDWLLMLLFGRYHMIPPARAAVAANLRPASVATPSIDAIAADVAAAMAAAARPSATRIEGLLKDAAIDLAAPERVRLAEHLEDRLAEPAPNAALATPTFASVLNAMAGAPVPLDDPSEAAAAVFAGLGGPRFEGPASSSHAALVNRILLTNVTFEVAPARATSLTSADALVALDDLRRRLDRMNTRQRTRLTRMHERVREQLWRATLAARERPRYDPFARQEMLVRTQDAYARFARGVVGGQATAVSSTYVELVMRPAAMLAPGGFVTKGLVEGFVTAVADRLHTHADTHHAGMRSGLQPMRDVSSQARTAFSLGKVVNGLFRALVNSSRFEYIVRGRVKIRQIEGVQVQLAPRERLLLLHVKREFAIQGPAETTVTRRLRLATSEFLTATIELTSRRLLKTSISGAVQHLLREPVSTVDGPPNEGLGGVLIETRMDGNSFRPDTSGDLDRLREALLGQDDG